MKKAIHRMIAGLTVAGALALPTAFAAAQAPTPQFDLTKVTDNVYSFRFLTHRAMVVVTSDGVIVTDPINSVAAQNMMDEIKKITNKPVKFVIYSHNHWDHVAGENIQGSGCQDYPARVGRTEHAAESRRSSSRRDV